VYLFRAWDYFFNKHIINNKPLSNRYLFWYKVLILYYVSMFRMIPYRSYEPVNNNNNNFKMAAADSFGREKKRCGKLRHSPSLHYAHYSSSFFVGCNSITAFGARNIAHQNRRPLHLEKLRTFHTYPLHSHCSRSKIYTPGAKILNKNPNFKQRSEWNRIKLKR